MSFEAYVAIGGGIILVCTVVGAALRILPKKLKREKYVTRWKGVQQRCSDKSQWATAIIEADSMLDEALRKKRFKGKSMGARLVAAQKKFTNNDAVWAGHKLRVKLENEPEFALTQTDVQKALVGIRQGLKDIGAL